MRLGSSVSLARDIQTLFDAGTASGLSDRQLVERFVGGSDGTAASAFEALVLRHGPMVLRVCSIRLRDWNDVEDAFQATFLILVKRCSTIRRRESVASWLYGVADRVSRRAVVESARRRVIEGKVGQAVGEGAGAGDGALGEVAETSRIIQDEVRRLPEKYRAVAVLCYWEGLSQEQAAAHLGCPIGTVRSRMARGKDLLRKRLMRRGVGAEPAALREGALGAPMVPSGLVSAVVKAGVGLGAGKSVVDVTTSSVAALAQAVLGSTVMIKLKTAVACFGLLGRGLLGVGLAAPGERPEKPKAAAKRAAQAELKKKAQPPIVVGGEYIVEPPDLILVEVLDALPGRPISGERLVRSDGKISLGYYGEIYVAGLTITEVKEKVITLLQRFLEDETLGLVVQNPETGEPLVDPVTKKPKLIDPKDSDRVFVDVIAYNSKNYYIQGEFLIEGRLPVTGSETVLDAIHFAGGLTPWADHSAVLLYRPNKDGIAEPMRIDVDEILTGDDLSTNYQLKAGDRLVARRDPKAGAKESEKGAVRATEPPKAPRESIRRPTVSTALGESDSVHAANGGRSDAMRTLTPNRRAEEAGGPAGMEAIERRLNAVERKLDAILEAVKKGSR